MTNKEAAEFWKGHLYRFACTEEEANACKTSIATLELLDELKRLCDTAMDCHFALFEVYPRGTPQKLRAAATYVALCSVSLAIDGDSHELRKLVVEE